MKSLNLMTLGLREHNDVAISAFTGRRYAALAIEIHRTV